MSQNSIKTYVQVVLNHFFYNNGPIDLVWAFFKAKMMGHTFCLHAGLCIIFWVHLEWPKCPKTAKETLFSGYFGPFLLQEWAY
tara:strand:- start:371 stop:619 length:249 start_codon:yes stop_codon:yes gene_type:complete